jgi:hypothetical protein
VICLRTDIEANLAVPEAMLARFSEVYSGPAIMTRQQEKVREPAM